MKHILNKLSILLLLLLMAATTQAQQNRKFHVQSFEQNQFDTSACVKATEKYDGNGDRYSIIKVTSTNPDDDLMAYSFDFGMMNSLVEQHDDELWVYVQRNAKHVTIKRAGYATVRNYDLRTTIQPGQVFDMVLSPEAAKIQKQMVYFKITQKDANATIMYKLNESGATPEVVNLGEKSEAAKNLTLGRYSYTVLSEDYYEYESMLVLDNTNETHVEEITLRPKFANVTLSADATSDIYIDSELKGTGTWSGRLNKGAYNVECRKANHKSTFETITIEEGNDITHRLNNPTPITGALSLMSEPLDAKIIIDGKEYGTTPRNLNDLLIGHHKLTLSKSGYATATVDIIINEGETTEQSVTLEKTDVNGTVSANGVVNGAITISKPRDPNELLRVACVNKNDGSIAYFTGAQWETLAADEKSQYAQLGVSIKESGHEFMIAANDCNNGGDLQYGGYGVDFAGVKNHNKTKSRFINTGYSDTKAMVEQQRGKTDSEGIVGVPAAEAAWNYKANEYDKLQWYLPSESELRMIYNNKKAINEFLSKYIDGATEIVDDSYWSSTENNKKNSWYFYMNHGVSSNGFNRINSYRVRAVSVVK